MTQRFGKLTRKSRFLQYLMIASCASNLVANDSQFTSKNKSEPILMTVFGDSATRATVADSSIGFPGLGFKLTYARAYIASLFYGKFSDAIDQGYYKNLDTNFGFLARDHLSGVIGNQYYSLPTKIRASTDRPLEIISSYFLAASYWSSPVQIKDVERRYQELGRSADIVTVNYNGIDFVGGRDVASFAGDVRNFYTWVAKHQPKLVIAAKYLDIVDLLIQSDQIAVPWLDNRVSTSCAYLLEQIGFAEKVGLYPNAAPQKVEQERQRLAQMNQVITDEIEMMNKRLPPYQNFTGKGLVLESKIPLNRWKDYIAADCIHPNKYAHRLLGENLWSLMAEPVRQIFNKK